MSKRDLHLQRLRDGLARIPAFRGRDARQRDPEFDTWLQDMIASLDVVLPDENHSLRLANMRFNDYSGGYSDYIPDHQKHRVAGLREAELLLASAIQEAEVANSSSDTPDGEPFVDPSRLQELRAKTPATFDLRRLVRMCEEPNVGYNNKCYLAVAMLTRAIIDHVPPLFAKTSFAEVASTYAGGRSFKQSMLHLETSARSIADTHLHQHIRRREVLPTTTQVSFQHDLDVLLGEIVRVL